MKNKTFWEWEFVILDKNGDIDHLEFSESLEDGHTDLELFALVRDRGNEEQGLLSRDYAYIKDGSLPAQTEEGYKIPGKYLKEFENFKSKYSHL